MDKKEILSKSDLIDAVAKKTGKEKKVVADIVDNVLGFIGNAAKDEKTLQLKNFGTFEVKTRAARKARNLRTNEVIDVPEKKYVHFKASKNISTYSFNL